jgi:hypothetical protein
MAVTHFFFSLSYSSLSPCLVFSKSGRIDFFLKISGTGNAVNCLLLGKKKTNRQRFCCRFGRVGRELRDHSICESFVGLLVFGRMRRPVLFVEICCGGGVLCLPSGSSDLGLVRRM